MAKVRVNWGRLDAERSVKLWVIYNTSHKSLYVLAPDRETALSIADTANHIYASISMTRKDRNYPLVEEIKGAPHDIMPAHWSLIESAIAQRLHGTVHVEENQVMVGYEIVAAR